MRLQPAIADRIEAEPFVENRDGDLSFFQHLLIGTAAGQGDDFEVPIGRCFQSARQQSELFLSSGPVESGSQQGQPHGQISGNF